MTAIGIGDTANMTIRIVSTTRIWNSIHKGHPILRSIQTATMKLEQSIKLTSLTCSIVTLCTVFVVANLFHDRSMSMKRMKVFQIRTRINYLSNLINIYFYEWIYYLPLVVCNPFSPLRQGQICSVSLCYSGCILFHYLCSS